MMDNEQPTILNIRGQEYKRWSYDWYIDEALSLAPARWSYDQVISLRDAIRENYQHGWNFPTEQLKGKPWALRDFIQDLMACDPAATIRESSLTRKTK